MRTNENDETPTSSVADKQDSNNKDEEDFYFTTSKLERNTMYSELLETYQDMYNNTNATS